MAVNLNNNFKIMKEKIHKLEEEKAKSEFVRSERKEREALELEWLNDYNDTKEYLNYKNFMLEVFPKFISYIADGAYVKRDNDNYILTRDLIIAYKNDGVTQMMPSLISSISENSPLSLTNIEEIKELPIYEIGVMTKEEFVAFLNNFEYFLSDFSLGLRNAETTNEKETQISIKFTASLDKIIMAYNYEVERLSYYEIDGFKEKGYIDTLIDNHNLFLERDKGRYGEYVEERIYPFLRRYPHAKMDYAPSIYYRLFKALEARNGSVIKVMTNETAIKIAYEVGFTEDVIASIYGFNRETVSSTIKRIRTK